MKIAVLLPVYNDADVIINALDSIKNQTFFKDTDNTYCIYLIDNCSTDSLQEKVKNYENLKYFYSPYCGSISISSNIGLIEIYKDNDCDYIACIGSDDEWYLKKLEIQMNYMLNNPEIDICTTGVRYQHKNGRWADLTYAEKHDDIVNLINKGYVPLCHGAAIFKKYTFLKSGFFDPTYKRGVDKNLWQRAKHHCIFGNVPEILYLYNYSGDDFWNNPHNFS
jgi:glycosyltransferase involved in cell wall biosynthesis